MIGIVGLRPPNVVVKPLSKIEEVVPVVWTPPEEQPKPQPEIKEEEPQTQDTEVETPQVVTIVAAADTANVAFAVPTEGVVAIAKEARFAAPPPPVVKAPPKPVKFDPSTSTGNFPPPQYPGMAQRNRYQGTVTLEIIVDAGGNIVEVKVQKSSGFNMLDDAAVKVVKERWKFPPGQARDYLWDCTFNLQ
jgi:protein TonB